MADDITTASGRKALKPRGAPYWEKRKAGCFIGYRKLTEGAGTWLARWRDEAGKQHYHPIGSRLDDDRGTFDAVAKLADEWFNQCETGSHEVVTVKVACARYVEHLRVSKKTNEQGQKAAADAAGRFKRLVDSAPIGRIELGKLKTAHIKSWLDDQIKDTDDDERDPDAERRNRDSANRNLRTLKAALNFAYKQGLASATTPWDRVSQYEDVAQRRERFLTAAERKRIYAAASPELKPLIKALMETAARPGEIASCLVGDLNQTNQTLVLRGKTGRRTVPLSTNAFRHLKQCAGKRSVDEPLIVRDNGSAWDRYSWRDSFQEARSAANIVGADEVVIYSLRHCAISEMVINGMDLMTVARLAGTSIDMINSHYGHLEPTHAKEQLNKIKML
ncbi:MAG: site-specific integrase [Dechloromonas sp.]|nr:site-specific integrase [Dechloromonas sp.]